MPVKNLDKKLKALLSKGENVWEIKAMYRKENKFWLIHARKIAFNLLQYMEKNGITKEALAVDLCIDIPIMDKVLQGKHNIDLELLCNIEIFTGVKVIYYE